MRENKFEFILECKKTKEIVRTKPFSLDEILHECGEDFIFECDYYYLDGKYIECNIYDDWICDFEIVARIQYTGLKDNSKEEVETYECDIVKMTDGDGWELGLGLVEFKNGKFVVVHKDGLDICLSDIPFEVIGNIYENKDLLEEKESE